MSSVSCPLSDSSVIEPTDGAAVVPRWEATPRIEVHDRAGVAVLDLGTKQIWDGSDLSLLRDTLVDLSGPRHCHAVGIAMRHVKGIPTGFFGMLHDLHVGGGVAVHLFDPRPHICRMLWFRTFFEPEGDGGFLLLADPKPNVVPGAYHFWASLRGEDFDETAAGSEFAEPEADEDQ